MKSTPVRHTCEKKVWRTTTVLFIVVASMSVLIYVKLSLDDHHRVDRTEQLLKSISIAIQCYNSAQSQGCSC